MQMPVVAAMQMSTVARGVRRASRNMRREQGQSLEERGRVAGGAACGVSGPPLRRPAPPAFVQVHHIGSTKASLARAKASDLEFAYDVGLDMNDFGGERFDICSEASDHASPCADELEEVDFLCVAKAPPSKVRRTRLLARFREELLALVCAR